MNDIHYSKISEKDSDICALEAWFCACYYTKQTKVMECFLRSLQISQTVYVETFQVHLNCMQVSTYKFLERKIKFSSEGGQNTNFFLQAALKV